MNSALKYGAVAIGASMFAAAGLAVPKDAFQSDAIHTDGPIGTADYYGSGNDDAFMEYGIASWNFTAADFGFASVTSITSATLSLTVNDRSFSDGDAVEFFYSPDDDSALGGGFAGLSANPALVNGIDGSQFVTAPVSLGVFNITEMAGRPGGEIDMFSLNFTGSALASLISEINAGSDFQILIGATDSTHDITYSGVGNTFDPGNPNLDIVAVPTPGAAALLGLSGLIGFRRRR